jgi:hypothetical protein
MSRVSGLTGANQSESTVVKKSTIGTPHSRTHRYICRTGSVRSGRKRVTGDRQLTRVDSISVVIPIYSGPTTLPGVVRRSLHNSALPSQPRTVVSSALTRYSWCGTGASAVAKKSYASWPCATNGSGRMAVALLRTASRDTRGRDVVRRRLDRHDGRGRTARSGAYRRPAGHGIS